jgi:DNA-binding IclR family transcriptional regulator
VSDAGFGPRDINLTDRARLYLRCIDNWKAPYEVAASLGDTPPPTINDVRRMLGRLAARGFVDHHEGNNTYRISEEGREALVGSPPDHA